MNVSKVKMERQGEDEISGKTSYDDDLVCFVVSPLSVFFFFFFFSFIIFFFKGCREDVSFDNDIEDFVGKEKAVF